MSVHPPPPVAAAMPGISLGLARINRLLSLLRSPQLATPIVHISGTNGKGSVSAYLSSILSHSQLAVGRFNSPHLVDEWDCVQLHGRAVDAPQFYSVKREVEQVSQKEGVGATSFEVLTATAFSLFARADPPLDLAVVEVGMGGAEDATNVVPADKTLLSVVTSVDLDHQKFLGDTVHEIAQVKAGIAREGGDVVLSVQAHAEAREAVLAVARAKRATVWEAGEATLLPPADEPNKPNAPNAQALPPPPLVTIPLDATSVHPPSAAPLPTSPASLTTRLPLPGSYQLSNAATAVLAAQLLRTLSRTCALVPKLESRVTDASMRSGVEATRWPGRLSWLSLTLPASPPSSATSRAPVKGPWRVLLDGAHNPSSAALLAAYLDSLRPPVRPAALIFALSAPRDPADVLRPLVRALAGGGTGEGAVTVVCTAFTPPAGMDWVRATAPAELAHACAALVRAEEGLAARVRVAEAEDVEGALRLLDEAGVGGAGTTVVAGSLYLAADVLRLERRVGRDEAR